MQAFILTLFSSCEEEIDLYIEDKGKPIVYGLLNLKDTLHYIKLYESLQNSEDNSPFEANPDEYIVQINEYIDGEKTGSDILAGEIVEPSNQSTIKHELIYKYNKHLAANAEYELIVTNKKNGLVTSDKTEILGERDIEYSVREQTRANNYISFQDFESLDVGQSPVHFSHNHSHRFYYLDLLSEDTVTRFIEYIDIDYKYYEDADTMYGNIHESIFNYLADNIPVIPGIRRKMIGIDYYYEVQDIKLQTYCNQYQSSVINNTEIDLMIENGFGIFASTYDWCHLALYFDWQAIDSLANSQKTWQLGFLNEPWIP